MRLASMVLPEPGGPIIRMLCPPAQATSSARLAVCCPRTSLKSTVKCCDFAQQRVADRPSRAEFRCRCSEMNHVEQRLDRIDFDAADHRGFPGIQFGHDQA